MNHNQMKYRDELTDWVAHQAFLYRNRLKDGPAVFVSNKCARIVSHR